jgi:3-hydroxymyristoyl/3-hydroxydecanoyl-(acyl carrier protein) dehydratase
MIIDFNSASIPFSTLSVVKKSALLPHGGPALRFLEEDMLFNYTTGILIAKKIVLYGFDFFGHFPKKPIYPSHCIIEGLGLAAGVLGKILNPFADGGTFQRNIKLKNSSVVLAGDTLFFLITKKKMREAEDGKIAIFSGCVYNQRKELVADGDITGVDYIEVAPIIKV